MVDTQSLKDTPKVFGLPDFLLDPVRGLLVAAGICPHFTPSGQQITAPDASDLPTLLTLVKTSLCIPSSRPCTTWESEQSVLMGLIFVLSVLPGF